MNDDYNMVDGMKTKMHVADHSSLQQFVSFLSPRGGMDKYPPASLSKAFIKESWKKAVTFRISCIHEKIIVKNNDFATQN